MLTDRRTDRQTDGRTDRRTSSSISRNCFAIRQIKASDNDMIVDMKSMTLFNKGQ